MVFPCWGSKWRHNEDEPHQGGVLQEFIWNFVDLLWAFDVTPGLNSVPKSLPNSS